MGSLRIPTPRTSPSTPGLAGSRPSGAGDCRKSGADLDGGDRHATLCERDGRLSGAWADLQHPISGCQSGQLDQVVIELRWAHRSGAVVILSRLVEDPWQPEAFRLARGIIRR